MARSGCRQCLSVLAYLPIDTAAKLELLGRVDDFVFGHVLRAGEVRHQDDHHAEANASFVAAQLRTGGYPHLQALQDGADPRAMGTRIAGLFSDEERFEHGLRALLDGSALQLGMPVSPEPA